MRKLIFALLLLPMFLQGQSNYKQGYVITNGNDTLRGWIDYRTDYMNSQNCRFKKDLSNDVKTDYAPEQIAGYRFAEEGKYYISRAIKIDGRNKQCFLEYLIQGVMNLYYYPDKENDLDYYIFEDKHTGEMTYITKHPDEIIEKDGEYYSKSDVQYKNILTYYTFKDCEAVQKDVVNVDFTHKSMIGLAKNYHNLVCTTGEQCIEFETKQDKHYVKCDFFVSAGIEFRVFKDKDYPFYSDEKTHTVPFLKAGIALSVPRWSKSISALFNIYATQMKYSFQRNNLGFQVGHTVVIHENNLVYEDFSYLDRWDYSTEAFKLGSNMTIKYTYHKGKVRPSAEFGIDLVGYTFKGNYYSYQEYVNTAGKIIPPVQEKGEANYSYTIFNSFNAGIGVNFLVAKDNFLFLNMNYKNTFIFVPYYHALNLELGYMF